MTTPEPGWLELGDEALPLLLDEFWHDDPLSLALKSLIEQTAGRIRAWLPAGVDHERALAARQGGFLSPGETHRGNGWIIQAVNSLIEARDDLFSTALREDPQRVCILPEFNPRPDHPSPPQNPGVFWVAGRCYHWLDGAMDREVLDTAFQEAELSWNGYALLARRPTGRSREELQSVDGLRALAEAAEQVSFRAYDGESFWIWSPRDRLTR